MSADIKPTESPGPHYHGDVMDLRTEDWDLVIAFPPCTYLSYAGNRHWNNPGRAEQREAGVKFARQFEDWAPKVAIENPTSYLQVAWRKPDQRINPWQFGDPYRKKTCLWLKNLPPLMSTDLTMPIANWVASGKAWQTTLPQLHSSARMRAKSFEGIAAAMADQWGDEQ